jgi:hypothetical protein
MRCSSSRPAVSQWVSRISLVSLIGSTAALALLDFFDGRLELVTPSSLLLARVDLSPVSYRVLLLVLPWLLLVSLMLFAGATIFGAKSQRNLRHLFLLTTMIGAALALHVNWQRISWEGRRWRMADKIASLQSIYDALQADWPQRDMDHELLGPIMVYPQWNPSTLILLTPKPVDERLRIAAIDRSSGEILRFELSSGYETIWLEHRTDSQLPNDFSNGIHQKFTRQYSLPMSSHWFLVRYQGASPD